MNDIFKKKVGIQMGKEVGFICEMQLKRAYEYYYFKYVERADL